MADDEKILEIKKAKRMATLVALAALLPGDQIHYEAPISISEDPRHKIAALDAAQMKRLRKAKKRKALLKERT